MAVGQSPLSCWIRVAGAQELFWPGCYALAAENYSFGQESQPNGPILLIQPKGLHTAALSFTAREEDRLTEAEEKERHSGEQLGVVGLDSKTQRVVLFTTEKDSSWTSSSISVCVWTADNHTKPLGVAVFDWLRSFIQNYNQDGVGLWKSFYHRFLDLYPHTGCFAHFLVTFHLKQDRHHSSCDTVKKKKKKKQTDVSFQMDSKRGSSTD